MPISFTHIPSRTTSDHVGVAHAPPPPNHRKKPIGRAYPVKKRVIGTSQKNAKKFRQHTIVHKYTDRKDVDLQVNELYDYHVCFPMKLHELLYSVEAAGLNHIVSWQPHGRCFRIHQKEPFVDIILPLFFHQSHFTSFQRQLNLYGFNRLTHGADSGGYYHEYFLKGRPFLSMCIVRNKVKGTNCKGTTSPDDEPNFYSMTYIMGESESQQPQPIVGSKGMADTIMGKVVYSPPLPHYESLKEDAEKARQPTALNHNTQLTSDTLSSIDRSEGDWDMDDDDLLWWMETNHICDICELLMDRKNKPKEVFSTCDEVIHCEEPTLNFMTTYHFNE